MILWSFCRIRLVNPPHGLCKKVSEPDSRHLGRKNRHYHHFAQLVVSTHRILITALQV